MPLRRIWAARMFADGGGRLPPVLLRPHQRPPRVHGAIKGDAVRAFVSRAKDAAAL
jgi:hypothetical protein